MSESTEARWAAVVAEAAATMESPQYNQPPSKLAKAKTVVLQRRVSPTSTPGTCAVVGSKGTLYTVTEDGCSCKLGTLSQKTKYACYHAVSVVLQARALAFLHPGQATLPLPPITIEERLAVQVAPQSTSTPAEVLAVVPVPEPILEAPSAPYAPEETAMAAPRDDEYIPEPEPLTPLVMAPEPPVTGTTLVRLREPAVVRAPETTLNAAALEASLEEWSKQRAVLTRFIKQHLVEGVDYGKIHVAGNCDRRYDCTNAKHFSKDCLFKPGSEKVLGLLRLRPVFSRDEETWDMLGRPPGVLFYRCTLLTPSGEVAGEGRGARDLQKDKGDINKAVKMCQKVAQVDAILRTGHLSDAFTQDLDQEPEVHAPAPDPAPAPVTMPARPGPQAREEIVRLLRADGFSGTTRDEYAAAVLERTGLTLVPDHYPAIVAKLQDSLDALPY